VGRRDIAASGAWAAAPALLALACLACGGGASSAVGGGSPTPTPEPLASPPYFVTVSATGVAPQVTHVWQGRAVIFRNEDSRPHRFFMDAHPTHQECSGLLNVGELRPGERREVRNLPVNACFFHGEDDPANRAFWGVVVVH
jgi:hypothetical protein